MPVDEFIDVASKISTPLGLSGLFAAIFFFLLKEILRKDIFPSLSQRNSHGLLIAIVNRIFYLSFAAMVLGFIAYLMPTVLGAAYDDRKTKDPVLILDESRDP